ncbi:hypothetical protein C1I99_24570 [Micromonospora deserti]|uniref:Transposase IS701-like DDE domain-containing protein n=1 Tax=Micromonospora deserti TaxID=2070366 RepID=A0A2W2CBP2_9ACTN|nr:hypothetical protein C1I99_24570 [Micromonospora deserti]
MKWAAGEVPMVWVLFRRPLPGDPDAVLIADETGFLKKGTKSAGVQRPFLRSSDDSSPRT